MIYELLWVPSSLNLPEDGLPRFESGKNAGDLNLLLSCKKIYEEAMRRAFTRHTFIGGSGIIWPRQTAITPIGPYNAVELLRSHVKPLVRSVAIHYDEWVTLRLLVEFAKVLPELNEIILLTKNDSIRDPWLRGFSAAVHSRSDVRMFIRQWEFELMTQIPPRWRFVIKGGDKREVRLGWGYAPSAS